MDGSNKTYDAALERLNEYIADHGMRHTPEREMVLMCVCQLPQPFTADELEQACQNDRISHGTIYNALELFITAQILHANNRQKGRHATEYELISGNKIRMQYICQECGRTVEMHDKAISRLIRERKYSNFELQHFSLYVYGQCKICRSKKAKQE